MFSLLCRSASKKKKKSQMAMVGKNRKDNTSIPKKSSMELLRENNRKTFWKMFIYKNKSWRNL